MARVSLPPVVRVPLPLACDGVHIVLGVTSGMLLPRRGQHLAFALFVFYQVVQELPFGRLYSFTRDSLAFALGWALGVGIRWAAVAAVRRRRRLSSLE